MRESWLTIPHVSQFDEADITALMKLRPGNPHVVHHALIMAQGELIDEGDVQLGRPKSANDTASLDLDRPFVDGDGVIEPTGVNEVVAFKHGEPNTERVELA